jgi:tetratricopeptide (TPR) repeat protein
MAYKPLFAFLGILFSFSTLCVFSQTASDYYRQGNEAFDRKDYYTAIEQYKKVINLTPSYKEAHWNLALSYFETKQYSNAVASYGTAISYYTEYKKLAELYYWRGRSKKELGEIDGAIGDYNSSLSYDATYGDSYWSRGGIYMFQKIDYPKAIEDFKKAISYISDRYDQSVLYGNICQCNYKMKKNDEALTNCNKSLELNAENKTTYWDRALVYAAQKKNAEAIKDYTKALQYYTDASDRSILYSNIGLTQLDLSQNKEALQSFTKSLEYNPNYGNAHWNLGAAFKNLARYEESAASYTKAIDFYKNDFESLSKIHYWRGFVKGKLEDYSAAIADFNKAIEYRPSYGAAYWERALIYEKLMNYSKSIEDYRIAITYYQDDKKSLSTLNSNIAAMEKGLGKYDNAIASYKKAIELNPERKALQADIGDMYLHKKDYTNAITHYTNWIEADTSKNPGALTKSLRGYCYMKTNNRDRAIADLITSLDWDIKIDTCYTASLCQFTKGDKQMAYDNLNRRIRIASKITMPGRQVDLAKLYAIDNNDAEAIKNLDLALKSGYRDYFAMFTAWELDALRSKQAFKTLMTTHKVISPY